MIQHTWVFVWAEGMTSFWLAFFINRFFIRVEMYYVIYKFCSADPMVIIRTHIIKNIYQDKIHDSFQRTTSVFYVQNPMTYKQGTAYHHWRCLAKTLITQLAQIPKGAAGWVRTHKLSVGTLTPSPLRQWDPPEQGMCGWKWKRNEQEVPSFYRHFEGPSI